MKKIMSLVLVTAMLVSLTGCDLISGLLGGGGYDLEEGESHIIITADGELTAVMAMSEDVLDEDFDADIGDDEEDIMADMQDMIDDQLDEWDIDTDIEITEVKVKDDVAFVTLVSEDFEFLFPQCYETLEDYADMMGGYEVIAEATPFITYEDEDDVDEDDLEDYADGTVIGLDGGEEGTYFEFEDDIALVSDDMDFEMIESNIIYVEGDESGLIVIDGEIDCDPDFFGFLMGDVGGDTGGDSPLDPDNNNDGGTPLDPDNNNDGGTPLDPNNGDTTGDNPLNPDSNNDDNNDGSIIGGNFIGTYTDSYDTQEYMIYSPNGSATKNVFIYNDEFSWYLEVESTVTDAELQTAIDTYLTYYFYDVELQNVNRTADGVMLTIYADDATNITYDYGTTLEELISWYEDSAEFATYYTFIDYQTGAPIDSDVLQNMSASLTASIDGGEHGTIYEFPNKILFIDESILWQRIDDNSIYVDYWEYGTIIFE
jgi:hypothetical protein